MVTYHLADLDKLLASQDFKSDEIDNSLGGQTVPDTCVDGRAIQLIADTDKRINDQE